MIVYTFGAIKLREKCTDVQVAELFSKALYLEDGGLVIVDADVCNSNEFTLTRYLPPTPHGNERTGILARRKAENAKTV